MKEKKYKILFSKNYLKGLEKIPKKDQKAIRENISSLAHNPHPEGCGDYRVVYTIKGTILLILVIEVGHRKDIYR
ncbi:type II toxin-antitoxin system RelE/ParE family toxin [Parachlamydia sp. AcF125]|uniref:type II toxin-antitoxin system RelE family toxin n=1 Tax=Parachlamydia sp. AcF125 TaxID=2795736 RepID=UPI001BD7FBE7|nr:hypothetical protein [Parachlamydia sp. AcF125]